jgi:hypothetical protein
VVNILKDPAYNLWKSGRCHIMQGKIIPVLDTISGRLLCTDGIPEINLSFGFILRNVETGELRYYHSSQNNSRMFDVPHLIRTEED